MKNILCNCDEICEQDILQILSSIYTSSSCDASNLDVKTVLKVISDISEYDIFLFIKDHQYNLKSVNAKNIPQFSKFDSVFDVIKYINESPESNLNWEKLGYFTGRKDAKKGAKVKYGENHYKLAVQLGLAFENQIKATPIGLSVYNIKDEELKRIITGKLSLGIPIIQQLLLKSESESFNAYEYLKNFLSESTAYRRRSNVKYLLSMLDENAKDVRLSKIISNISWSKI